MLTVTYAECHIKALYAECRGAHEGGWDTGVGRVSSAEQNNRILNKCGPA
jgi:hypothetical protein